MKIKKTLGGIAVMAVAMVVGSVNVYNVDSLQANADDNSVEMYALLTLDDSEPQSESMAVAKGVETTFVLEDAEFTSNSLSNVSLIFDFAKSGIEFDDIESFAFKVTDITISNISFDTKLMDGDYCSYDLSAYKEGFGLKGIISDPANEENRNKVFVTDPETSENIKARGISITINVTDLELKQDAVPVETTTTTAATTTTTEAATTTTTSASGSGATTTTTKANGETSPVTGDAGVAGVFVAMGAMVSLAFVARKNNE